MTGGALEWPTRDLVSHRVATTPQRTALMDDETGRTWTFRELDRRVDRVAAALESRVGSDLRSTRIALLMDTRPAFAVCVFAAMRTGAAIVPLNVRETPAELRGTVDRTEPAALVCERETEPAALEIGREPPESIGSLPVLSVDEPETDAVDELAVEPSSDEAPAVDPVPLERSDELVVMFTSGTSGEPKGVPLTVENLVSSATASAFRLGVGPDDRWLCCLPMYHMGGLAPVVRSALYGTPVVIQRTFDRHETQRVLAEYDCTGVSLVPTMCKRLLEAGWEPEPDDALRFVLLGGAPATSELLERCRAADIPVRPTYGMTETASQIATATADEVAAHDGTVGQPLVCTDVTVVDEDGEPLPPGETGELVVSGPTVTPGYLSEAVTADRFCEYGLRTGDIGHRDSDGRLWVLNRRSDRIVTGGENVDPGEVLEALRSHPTVDDGAVVGLEDPEWGERVAALVVPDENDSGRGDRGDLESGIDLESLLAHCGNRLAGFKQPKTVGVAASLPRTASGTVDREAVRAQLLEDGVDVPNST
ncbi:class I adenylate-forming enzyme family protein [Natronolimnohabitans innermongolicus]|uniref:O-succinylbenzoate--CoA ligase n=1 Tax=Natronolimnohabitans innermongolicus JCM 12255 TaxID=1227499 RepID=L9XKG2_9EURY|nr:class I adenylate-forming enzyme family protein [Natronolimnohabitans innermongolicus]ELY62269.1 o-succinylbenzoate--CoA ligase [Natronolimnohabitans innermongolicus JCM 12255]